MNKRLFIGGPHDGKRIALRSGTEHQTRVQVAYVSDYQTIGDRVEVRADLATYYGMPVYTREDEEHFGYKQYAYEVVMVHESIPEARFWRTLIEGYRRP